MRAVASRELFPKNNAAASNRAEQPVDKNGSTGDFTNFDIVDYEIGKHVVTYDIQDKVKKVTTGGL